MVFALGLLSGCGSPVDLSNIDLWRPTLDVTVYSTGRTEACASRFFGCEAVPEVGRLVVCMSGHCEPLAFEELWKTGNGGIAGTYVARLSALAPGELVEVRSNAHPLANVVLPAALSVSATRASDRVELNWSPSGTTDHMALGLTGTCDDGVEFSRRIPIDGDPGALVLSHICHGSTLSAPVTLELEGVHSGIWLENAPLPGVIRAKRIEQVTLR